MRSSPLLAYFNVALLLGLCPCFIRALLQTFGTSSRSRIRRRDTKRDGERDVGDSAQKLESTDHEIMDAAVFMSIVQSLSTSLLHRETLQTFTMSRTVTLVIVALIEAEGERNKDKSTFMAANYITLTYCLLWLL